MLYKIKLIFSLLMKYLNKWKLIYWVIEYVYRIVFVYCYIWKVKVYRYIRYKFIIFKYYEVRLIDIYIVCNIFINFDFFYLRLEMKWIVEVFGFMDKI